MSDNPIHPTAIVEPGARLGSGVRLGAYAYVGTGVTLGSGTHLHHHACVEGNTTVGTECEIFPYACIGGRTQDLKYKGGKPGLRVGDRNVFREYVTVHEATADGDHTVIGSDNYFLAYAHVAHDCVVGDHIVISNAVAVAGHVHLSDYVTLGGHAGIHQFCRVGTHAMVSGKAKVVQDVPPYLIADGMPATIRAVNKVGLERSGYSPEQLERIKQLYRILYRDGLNRSQALEKLSTHPDAHTPEYELMVAFARESERGLAPGG